MGYEVTGMSMVLGMVIGSFLNVVVYRLNNNESPLRGRSLCPTCRHQLAWYDNIPLLSFLLLKGRCRYCHSPICLQYPLVELLTGILTVLVIYSQNFKYQGPSTKLIFDLLIAYCLVAIFVSDWRYYIIPDEVVLFGVIVALFFIISQSPTLLVPNFLAGLGAAGALAGVVWLTKGKGMGWGDVKLAGLMGLVLGWPKVAWALEAAFLTGAVAGVILILIGRKKLKSRVAFGPFLAWATLIFLLCGDKIIWQTGAVLP